uniref:Uncharacterized protein n=2 Tax=Glossina austeni TaxID=7395 RepID=A0A1A9VI89_GLOAU
MFVARHHAAKGSKAVPSFRDLNELFVKTQSAKVDLPNGLEVSNLASLAWKISQEEVDHRTSITTGRKLDNSNAGRELPYGLLKKQMLLEVSSEHNQTIFKLNFIPSVYTVPYSAQYRTKQRKRQVQLHMLIQIHIPIDGDDGVDGGDGGDDIKILKIPFSCYMRSPFSVYFHNR